MRWLASVLLMVALPLLAAGCGGEEEAAAPTPATSATTAASAQTTPGAVQPSPPATAEGTRAFGSSLSQEGADSPEGAVALLLEGLTENDQDKMLDAMDPDFRDEPLGPANLGIFVQGLFSVLTGADIGQLEISFRDISFRTEYEEDPDFATVYMSGRMRALGREETLYDEPTPTVRKFGRWFVTSEESPYFADKARRAEEEEAARQKEAEEAKRKADIERISATVSVTVSEPRLLGCSDCCGCSYDADVTFRNSDTIPHKVNVQTFADYVCPEGFQPGRISKSSVIVGANVAPGGTETTQANTGGYIWDVACYRGEAREKAQPIGAQFSVCIWSVDDYQDIALSGWDVCDY